MTEKRDYQTITELPGMWALPEGLDMMLTRYSLARRMSKGKEVLEVACGSGIGLDYVAMSAKRVVGVDVDENNIALAKRIYGDRFDVTCMDAGDLRFRDGSFDVVLLLEAIYWLPDAPAFIREARRVLRPRGKLLIVSVNPEWLGWTSAWAARFSTKYYTGRELRDLLVGGGFQPRIKASFRSVPRGPWERLAFSVRKLLLRSGLVPTSNWGRQLIKRWVSSRASPFPDALTEGCGRVRPPVDVNPEDPIQEYRIIYGIGELGSP